MKRILGNAVMVLLVMTFPALAQQVPANEGVDPSEGLPAVSGEQLNVDVALIALGNVVRTEAGRLIISEYEYETDMDQENTYLVNEETQYENVAGLQGLNPGDPVEVIYQESGNDRIVLAVMKEEDYIDMDEGIPGEEKVHIPLINEEVDGTAPWGSDKGSGAEEQDI